MQLGSAERDTTHYLQLLRGLYPKIWQMNSWDSNVMNIQYIFFKKQQAKLFVHHQL